MTKQKAFWQALMTVVIAALLVVGFFFFLLGPHWNHWFALAIIIALPALFMLPFVYGRYMSGPRPPPTSQQHGLRAIEYVLFAIGFFALLWIHPEDREGKWVWIMVGSLLINALYNLYRAYMKRKVLPVVQ